MKPRSTTVILSVALGICACIACTTLVAGIGYVALTSPDPVAEVALQRPDAATKRGTTNVQFPLKGEELTSVDEKAVEQAEQALIDWMRNTSGARAQLGTGADEVFRRVDEARAASIQKLTRQYLLQSQAKPLGKPAALLFPLPPSPWEPRLVVAGESTAHVLAFLATAPLMFGNRPQDVELPPSEFDSTESTPAGKINTQYKLQLMKVVGSQSEVGIEITIRVEKDGLLYEEKVGGTALIDVCPNAQGEVPLELTLHGNMTVVGDAGTQFQFKAQATGNVDDEANLVSYDIQTQAEMARQPGSSGKAKGENNQYLEWNQRYSMKGLSGSDVSISGVEVNGTRASSKADQKFADESSEFITRLSTVGVMLTLMFAEAKWQDGYCIEVSVPEMEPNLEKTVSAGSETSFTAKVRHRFEGKELAVPVIANLASGGESVSPAGSKVPAPANFRYRAPTKGGRTAKVELESRSRRGVGKLELSFTRSVGWRVNQPFGDGARLTGLICERLDNPFFLEYAAPQHEMSGQYTFIPSSEEAGTFTHAGTAVGGIVTNTGDGTYKIETAADGKPVIRMNGKNIQVTRAGGMSSTHESVFDATINLEPVNDECR